MRRAPVLGPRPRLVGIGGKKNLVFKILAGTDAFAQLQHLPGNEVFDLVRLGHSLFHRKIRILRW